MDILLYIGQYLQEIQIWQEYFLKLEQIPISYLLTV